MNASRQPRHQQQPPDELPDDPALQALVASTTIPRRPSAFEPGAALRPAGAAGPGSAAPADAGQAGAPATALAQQAGASSGAGPVASLRPVAAASGPAAEEEPASTGSTDHIIRQATVLVTVDVSRRFDLRKRQEGAIGPRPTNTDMVFRALNETSDRYSAIVTARRPQAVPGDLFGAPVPGRRTTTESIPRTQLAFRPTIGEMRQLKRVAQDAGARSVSEFVDAVLDAWLPASPTGRRPQR